MTAAARREVVVAEEQWAVGGGVTDPVPRTKNQERMTIVFLLLVVASLAYANGANDVSKGVGTLVGSRLTTYRRGLAWGTLWTVAGAIVAVVVSVGLVRTFSTGLLVTPPAEGDLFSLAVAAGAFSWVILASRIGLPVSTTHTMTGAIVGTALASVGVAGVRWPLLVISVALPLAVSPLVAGLVAYFLHSVSAEPLSRASQYCICVETRPTSLVPASASVTMLSGDPSSVAVVDAPTVVVDDTASCERTTVSTRVGLTDAAHWGTSAALSFARGLNDNPKIVALGLGAAAAVGLDSLWIFVAGAAAMGLGSYWYGRRVTNTLAERVTKIDPLEGLSASTVAASLVLLASFVALPVSTTHVSTGAIVGAGLRSGAQAIRWRTVSNLIAAWIITVPAAGLLAAAVWIVIT